MSFSEHWPQLPAGDRAGKLSSPLQRSLRTAQWKMIVVIAALAATAFLVAAFSFVEISRMAMHSQRVARTHETIGALAGALSLVTDAETASRGFAVTGDNAFVQPFDIARRRMESTMDSLRGLAASDPAQQARLARLAGLVEQRVDFSAKVIAARRDGGFEAARAMIATGAGKKLHDAIRLLMAEMVDAENEALAQRQARRDHSAAMLRYAVSAGGVLALVVTAVALLLIRRDFSGARRSERQMQESNARLEQRVAQHTGELIEAKERLSHAEERRRLADEVFASAQEGIAITDLDGVIVAVNHAFETISEYREAELLGQRMDILRSGRHDGAFYRAMWAAVRSEGSWEGEIWDRRRSGEVFQQWLRISTVRDPAGKATHYVGVLTDISRMQHARSHLEYLAYHDELTGLPNRALLHAQLTHALQRARRSNLLCAVLLLDLDGFKPVNDQFGHEAGDQLLRLVAERIREHTRSSDTVARLGGDEFVVVLDDLAQADRAAHVAEVLVEALAQPFALMHGRKVSIGTSVGISLFPNDAADASALLRSADAAMYRAKAAGRGRWQFDRRHAA